MGQKRVSVVDLSAEEKSKKVSQKSVKKSAKKVMKTGKGAGRLADKSESLEEIKLEEEVTEKEELAEKKSKKAKEPRVRGRRYRLARANVDRTITYPMEKAIELVKKTTIARFDSTISAHLNVAELGLNHELTFPHSTGKQTRVAIATDALLKKIEKGKSDFDILLSTPDMMKSVAKVAKILGPRGLMPNPKNGTITDNPKKRQKELESGATQVKTESKVPIMHIVIGKTKHKTKDLEENLTTLIETVGQKQIKKLVLASTMSPGVKVTINSTQPTAEKK